MLTRKRASEQVVPKYVQTICLPVPKGIKLHFEKLLLFHKISLGGGDEGSLGFGGVRNTVITI